MILLVSFEVIRQIRYPCAQKRDLNFRRSRIPFMSLKISYYIFLILSI